MMATFTCTRCKPYRKLPVIGPYPLASEPCPVCGHMMQPPPVDVLYRRARPPLDPDKKYERVYPYECEELMGAMPLGADDFLPDMWGLVLAEAVPPPPAN